MPTSEGACTCSFGTAKDGSLRRTTVGFLRTTHTQHTRTHICSRIPHMPLGLPHGHATLHAVAQVQGYKLQITNYKLTNYKLHNLRHTSYQVSGMSHFESTEPVTRQINTTCQHAG